jgi:WD40 repeat protein
MGTVSSVETRSISERDPRLLAWLNLQFAKPLLAALFVTLAATSGLAPLAWAYRTGNYSWAVAVSHDGNYAIAGSDDMHTYFFDAKSDEGTPKWSHAAPAYVRHVAVSSNGTRAVASDANGNIFFFRSDLSGEPVWTYQANSTINALAMSHDGDYVVAGDRLGSVYLLVADGPHPTVHVHVIPNGVLSLSLSEPGALAVTSSGGGLYFFTELVSESGYAWVFQSYTSFPQVAISDDAKYIVAGGSDGYVYRLDRSGQLVDRDKLGGSVSALSLSSSSGRLVAGSTNGNVSLYEVGDGLKALSSLRHQRPITSTAISREGDRISIADLDGVISMFGGSLTTPLWSFEAGAIVHSISMADNGLVLAASSDNGNIYLFREQAQERTSEATTTILIAPAIVAGSLFLYWFWRRRMKNGTGKPYDRRESSHSREAP